MAESHIIGGRKEDSEYLGEKPSQPVDKKKQKLKDVVQNTKIRELLPPNLSVWYVTNTDTLSKALKLLFEHQILSVPVLNERSRKFISFVDVIDICCTALNYLEKGGKEGVDLDAIQAHFEKSPITQVSNASNRDPYKPVEDSASLKIALGIMEHHRVHRVPVIDSDGELITLLTQTAVMSFCEPYISTLPVASKKLSELEIGRRELISVTKNQRVRDALRLMRDKRVSGIAIVEKDGIVIGNISASDLKHLGYTKENLFKNITITLEQFMKETPKNPLIPGPICVTLNTTVEELWFKLVNTRVHRVYVVDEKGKGIGVISLTDCLKLLKQHL